jgi:hypothetical protein
MLVGSGVWLLAKRPRITVVHLSELGLGGVLASAFAALLLQATYTPAPLVSGWKAFAPSSEQNQLGYRGRRVSYGDEDYVVVFLDDSQVEVMGLGFDAMPERVLEAHLDIPGRRARVFSLGAGAYGTDQELVALEQYLARFRADLVVLWQTSETEIWNNVFNTHMASRNLKADVLA